MRRSRADWELKHGESKRDVRLAKFYRYGYFLCSFGLAAVLELLDLVNGIGMFWIGLTLFFYGIYTMLIMRKPERHFLLAMLHWEHQEMKLSGSGYDMFKLQEWRRDSRILAIFCLVLGVVCMIMPIVVR